jgi:thymidylate synthase ThyX
MDRTWRYLETSLTSLVDSMSMALHDDNREILTNFIENREFGVALEWLHSIIITRNLQLSEQQQIEIRQLAEFMKIDLSKVT